MMQVSHIRAQKHMARVPIWIMTGCLLLSLSLTAQGQPSPYIGGKSMVELRQEDLRKTVLPFLKGVDHPSILRRISNIRPPLNTPLKQELTAPTVYSYDELGLFCKFEVQLEQFAKIPIKLRLGDVQYVDWLEKKRDWPE